MTLETPAVTWEKAYYVLSALANVASVRDVMVVGSVARNREGNDLDVVLVVDTYTYIAFLKVMWSEYDSYYGNQYDNDEKSDYYMGYREQRKAAALAAIKFSPAEFGWLEFALQQLGADVDFHLMPEDWLTNIDAVQTHLPHKDPQFVRNIAGDARSVRTTAGRNGLRVVSWSLYKEVMPA